MLEHLEPYANQLLSVFTQNTPRILLGFGILFVGWAAAKIIQKGFRVFFVKINMDKALPDKGRAPLSQTASKAIFYFCMLVVLLAFFHFVKLDIVAKPFESILGKIAAVIPDVAGAVIIAVAGYLFATVARMFVVTVGKKGDLDKWLGKIGIKETGTKKTPTEWAGDIIFFVAILIFLPAVFGSLKIEALRVPIQGLVEKVLAFSIKLLGSILIIAAAWLAASIFRPIVASILRSMHLDKAGEAIGLKMTEKSKLSTWFSDAFFVLVILVSLPAALTNLNLPTLAEPLSAFVEKVMAYLPNVAMAVLLVVLSWIIGRVIAGLLGRLLSGIRFDTMFQNMGLSVVKDPNELVVKTASTVAWVVIVLFGTLTALEILKFTALAALLSKSILFIPTILGAVVIAAAGLYFARFISHLVERSAAGLGERQAGYLSKGCYAGIVIFTASVALEQLALGTQTVTSVVRILAAGIAIAVALAVGLGSKDYVANWLKKYK